MLAHVQINERMLAVSLAVSLASALPLRSKTVFFSLASWRWLIFASRYALNSGANFITSTENLKRTGFSAAPQKCNLEVHGFISFIELNFQKSSLTNHCTTVLNSLESHMFAYVSEKPDKNSVLFYLSLAQLNIISWVTFYLEKPCVTKATCGRFSSTWKRVVFVWRCRCSSKKPVWNR